MYLGRPFLDDAGARTGDISATGDRSRASIGARKGEQDV
jgi:hypothetical protein